MPTYGVQSCTAFDAEKKVATGSVKEVALIVKEHIKQNPKAIVLIFDDNTSEPVEIDFRGTSDSIIKRIESLENSAADEEKKSGPGRPKLGVIAKEITLLPDHWEWLLQQPGGASVTLRRLVDDAKKKNFLKDQKRRIQDAIYKFMTAMAGNMSNYEEALRALYAHDQKKFNTYIRDWPKDIREHIVHLSKKLFSGKYDT